MSPFLSLSLRRHFPFTTAFKLYSRVNANKHVFLLWIRVLDSPYYVPDTFLSFFVFSSFRLLFSQHILSSFFSSYAWHRFCSFSAQLTMHSCCMFYLSCIASSVRLFIRTIHICCSNCFFPLSCWYHNDSAYEGWRCDIWRIIIQCQCLRSKWF